MQINLLFTACSSQFLVGCNVPAENALTKLTLINKIFPN